MPVCSILRSIPKILEFDEEKAGRTGVAGTEHTSGCVLWLDVYCGWNSLFYAIL